MKIIITYASAGAGHRRAAEAIYNYFKENCPALDLKIIDALEKTNFCFKNAYNYGYPFLVNHALWLWRFSFWLTYIRSLRPFGKTILSVINQLNTRRLSDFLIQEDPDFIISTHFLPSEIAARLKRKHKLASKLITVITDFGVHPFWIAQGTDTYVVACDVSKQKLIREGAKGAEIKILGIPIDTRFIKQYDKYALCRKFGLKPDEFTILIVTGSFGVGRIEEVVDLLYEDAQILAVCANNKKLYTRLKEKDYPRLRVFGFIDNIEELMAISDIMVAKPGGLTVSESLAMELLPVFITSIPGQETENADILSVKSLSINVRKITALRDIVLDFKAHPDKLKSIKENIRREKRPYAVKDLCNAICQGSLRPAN
ncbi:MAG: glycosyltransferase [Candidatus Omnitrophica bacterium]|nr:glycosyltransferase [Candidatus Omnitrophota bacterium]MDD5591946.1 glycosyltransferase [Candidatus Omnitrophota bacterium]